MSFNTIPGFGGFIPSALARLGKSILSPTIIGLSLPLALAVYGDAFAYEIRVAPKIRYRIMTGPVQLETDTAEELFAAYQQWLANNGGGAYVDNLGLPNIENQSFYNGVQTRYWWDFHRLIWPYDTIRTGSIEGIAYCPQEISGRTTIQLGSNPSTFLGYCQIQVPDDPDLKSCGVGNPVHPATGQKIEVDTDYEGHDGLGFQRTYRSRHGGFASVLSAGITDDSVVGVSSSACLPTSYVSSLVGKRTYCFPYIGTGAQEYHLHTPDGRRIAFTGPTGAITAKADVNTQLQRQVDASGVVQWQVTHENGDVEIYNARGALIQKTDRAGRVISYTYSDSTTPATVAPRPGLLIKITSTTGRILSFAYNAAGQMIEMTDPAGGRYQYEYDGPSGPVGANNLTTLTYPDGSRKIYHFNEPEHTGGFDLTNALTGITDERGIRYATFKYDAQGRAIGSEHAGGADKVTLSYSPGSTIVTDALGTTRTYTFETILGAARP
ncbi:MAG: hypothetical protein ACOZCP_09340, partial [Pseudomonadota bacterium]